MNIVNPEASEVNTMFKEKGSRSPRSLTKVVFETRRFKSGPQPYTLNELPQPHVLFTFGLLNLNPAPSIVST
jgi:hypothetical protein